MARSLGALYVLGAQVAWLWVALPGGDRRGETVVFSMATLALVAGAAMSLGVADRAPRWFFHAIIAWVQVLITVAYAAADGIGNDIRLFYFWATPFTCFFFAARSAVVHLAWVLALFSVGVASHRATANAQVSVLTMTLGTLLAVNALVLWTARWVRRREIALRHAADHDGLTGLANRRYFAVRAQQALDRRARNGGSVFVILADLDRFKAVNDTHGHLVGDQFLVALAPRVERAAPPGSVVARMGGDEFAVLVEDPAGLLDPDDVLDRLAIAWSEPVVAGDMTVRLSASIGLAVAGDGDTPSSLLRDADSAMYHAKRRSGRGGLCVFDAAQRERSLRRVAIEQALAGAIPGRQLHLVMQPIVDLHDDGVVAAEVLLRWTHPELGPIPPAEFVPLAEDTGSIVDLGGWVLDEAIAQLGRWRADGVVGGAFVLSVNLSGRQLRADLPGHVARALRRHDVPSRMLTLELTESVILDPSEETTTALAELRALGVLLALDDFGTGWSSLTHLQRTRFDTVKIDRSFVDGLTYQGQDRSIVGAILALGTSLGVHVVAEGVETRAQRDVLVALGCRYAQGYLFDRPLEPAQFAERMVQPMPWRSHLRVVGDTMP